LDFTITYDRFFRLSERRKRLSIDIDSKTDMDSLAVLRAFFILRKLFPEARVTVEKTGHGFHVKAVSEKIAQLPMDKRVQIRETLCDDPLRIEWDKEKLRWGDDQLCETLFTMKRGFDGKLHIVSEANPLMLPWSSRIPAKKDVKAHTARHP
jgi:hypothetical protein